MESNRVNDLPEKKATSDFSVQLSNNNTAKCTSGYYLNNTTTINDAGMYTCRQAVDSHNNKVCNLVNMSEECKEIFDMYKHDNQTYGSDMQAISDTMKLRMSSKSDPYSDGFIREFIKRLLSKLNDTQLVAKVDNVSLLSLFAKVYVEAGLRYRHRSECVCVGDEGHRARIQLLKDLLGAVFQLIQAKFPISHSDAILESAREELSFEPMAHMMLSFNIWDACSLYRLRQAIGSHEDEEVEDWLLQIDQLMDRLRYHVIQNITIRSYLDEHGTIRFHFKEAKGCVYDILVDVKKDIPNNMLTRTKSFLQNPNNLMGHCKATSRDNMLVISFDVDVLAKTLKRVHGLNVHPVYLQKLINGKFRDVMYQSCVIAFSKAKSMDEDLRLVCKLFRTLDCSSHTKDMIEDICSSGGGGGGSANAKEANNRRQYYASAWAVPLQTIREEDKDSETPRNFTGNLQHDLALLTGDETVFVLQYIEQRQQELEEVKEYRRRDRCSKRKYPSSSCRR